MGFSLELRTPPLQAAHVKVGTGHTNTHPGYVINVTADLQSTRHSTHATSCRTTCEVPLSLGHLNSRKSKFPIRGRHFRASRHRVRSQPVNDPG